jgi:hypothetical protein
MRFFAEPDGQSVLFSTRSEMAGLRLVTDPDLAAKITHEHTQWLESGVEKGLITKEMIRKKTSTTN